MTILHSPCAAKLDAHDEAAIRCAFDAGQLDLAATTAIARYRAELLSFIESRVRDPSDACEVLSIVMEHLWKGLPTFQWRCSMRTWSYCLARNALHRYVLVRARRGAHVAASEQPELDNIAGPGPQTPTPLYLHDSVQDRFRRLRETLREPDQMLLVLRVDRNMSFRDIALTLHGDPALGEEILARETVRLRKAFERIKASLRRLAEEEGLLRPRETAHQSAETAL